MQSLLIIGYTWPEPKTTGAGVRMMQLIHSFLNHDFKITFASAADKTKYSEDLNAFGVREQLIKLNDSTFDSFVKKLNPDVVVFDRFYTEEQYGWRVAESCPLAIRILDTEDLHFIRFAREEAVKKKKAVNFKNSKIALRELASIYRCDLSLIISTKEVEVLIKEFKIDNELLQYVPFIPNKIKIDVLPGFNQRQHFVFIGNYRHQPNVDAILELKKSIWPHISKELPQAALYCYGAYAGEQIKQLHNAGERFFINGWTENAHQQIQNARVMLAPLCFGAGLKGKLVDAMQCGTPFVTTSVGFEGFGNYSNLSFSVTDEIRTFSENAIKLYSDEFLWANYQKEGFQILIEQFLNQDFESLFFQKLKKLSSSLNSHREDNFIGSMLRYHNLQSTKYLSKWIEAKSKS